MSWRSLSTRIDFDNTSAFSRVSTNCFFFSIRVKRTFLSVKLHTFFVNSLCVCSVAQSTVNESRINNNKNGRRIWRRWLGTLTTKRRRRWCKYSVYFCIPHPLFPPEMLIFTVERIQSAQNEQTDELMENPQEVIAECLSKFCTSDYIMEPGIFTQLKRLVNRSHLFWVLISPFSFSAQIFPSRRHTRTGHQSIVTELHGCRSNGQFACRMAHFGGSLCHRRPSDGRESFERHDSENIRSEESWYHFHRRGWSKSYCHREFPSKKKWNIFDVVFCRRLLGWQKWLTIIRGVLWFIDWPKSTQIV